MSFAWRVLAGVAASSAGMASCGGKSQTVDGTDALVAGKDLYPRELGFESTASGDGYVLRIDQNLEIANEFRFSGAEPEVMALRTDGTLVIAGELWRATQLGDETHEASDDAYDSFLNGEGGVFGHDWVLWRLDPETL